MPRYQIPDHIQGFDLEGGNMRVFFVTNENQIMGSIGYRDVKRIPRKLKKQINNPNSLFWKKFYS